MSEPAFADDEGAGGEDGGEEDPPSDPPEDETPALPTSGLSDTQTSYTGAVMLRGGQEVTMETVVPGYVGNEAYLADGRYAYFSGNTLYAGVKDNENNYADLIAEFFWFESSIQRGSDFYVAVVKARTSPNIAKDWVLEHQSNAFLGYFLPKEEATLNLRAQTDISQGAGAFRWDWSIPFDNYGWDAYGNTTMETKYGLSLDSEGSAQKAFNFDAEGIPVEANVQAKGFFNKTFQVQTKYEVTLWRWEVMVHAAAGEIDWQLNLHSKDREKQNAYHEFFVVMQADQGVPFHLDWLEVGGSVRKKIPLWWDEHRSLSAAVTGIVLRPPQLPPPPPSDDGKTDDGEPDADPRPDSPQNELPGQDGDVADINNHNYYGGCSIGGSNDAGWFALALLLLGFRRRGEK